MDDLYLIGVHEDGDFLLLGGPGSTRFRLPIEDGLRAALRWERPGADKRSSDTEPLRPREVQAMVRAGASTQEAAERAGWTVEKVRRYEGPILAEREHVARLAGSAVLRSRTGVSFTAPSLRERVLQRLATREVNPEEVTWDSWRSEDGEWTVELHFQAGGRLRTASWRFSRTAMTVTALDDEARWLSEEEHPEDSPAVRHVVTSGRAHVYDIEAEGGLRPNPDGTTTQQAHEPPARESVGPDLIAAVRQRSGVQTRRRRGPRRGGSTPASLPGDVAELVPLEQIDYDPETMPAPPSAHADPDPLGPDGEPEPDALPYTVATEAVEPIEPPEPPAAAEPAVAAQPSAEKALESEPTPADEADPTATAPRSSSQRAQPASRQRAKSRARKSRPGVPAWDDIVFGGVKPPPE